MDEEEEEAEEEAGEEEEAEEGVVQEVVTVVDSKAEKLEKAVRNHLDLIPTTAVPTKVTTTIPQARAMVIIRPLLSLQEVEDVVEDVVVAAVACVEAHAELVKIIILNLKRLNK